MVQYVYKPKGQRVYRGRYRFRPQDDMVEIPLNTRDKRIAEQMLAEFVKDVEKERLGIIPPKSQRDTVQRKLSEHLEDFLGDLKATGRAARYISNIQFRVNRLLSECGWTLLPDVTAAEFKKWRERNGNLSAKTLNDYLEAVSCLLNWLKKDGRILINALESVERVETRGRKTRHRRAFTQDEIQRLILVAGEYRAVYLAAVHTGLRRKELRALQWGDVLLDSPHPFVRLRGATTKNHNSDALFLHEDVVSEFRAVKPEGAENDEPVFKRFPRIERFKRDLKRAGIEYQDAQGRVADFHSLRKTFNTHMAKNGTPLRVRMELMRHGDCRLTDETYIDESQLGTLSAIQSLPSYLKTAPQVSPHLSPHFQVANGGEASIPDTTGHGTDLVTIITNSGESGDLSRNDAKTQNAELAGVTGLEPATSAVTGQRSEPVELHPHPRCVHSPPRRRKPAHNHRRISCFGRRIGRFMVGAKGLEPLTPSV